MATHRLKTWPEYFNKVKRREKMWELRINDRDFQTGDTVVLAEWDQAQEDFTGDYQIFLIGYVFTDNLGIQPGWCIFSLEER